MYVLRRHPKPPEFFCLHRSPESCLQNAPASLGATSLIHQRLHGAGRDLLAPELLGRDLGFAVPKAITIEGPLLPEHVIDGPAQPRRQDAQGLGLAMLLLLSGQETLGLVTLPGQETGGLGEGPLQMGIADLGSTAAFDLPSRCLQRPYQPGVRQKLSLAGETA